MSDLTTHEFADITNNVKASEVSDQRNIILDFGDKGKWLFLNRDDVEVMAKHFNLIPEK